MSSGPDDPVSVDEFFELPFDDERRIDEWDEMHDHGDDDEQDALDFPYSVIE